MDYTEVRRYRRVNLEPGVLIQFKSGGRFFMGLDVVCLGACGCSVMISKTLAASLSPEAALDRILLQHRDLPRDLLRGKVPWIRGRQPNLSEHSVLLGIEFLDPPETFIATVDAYILEALKA